MENDTRPINRLTVYYSLAIKRNINTSVETRKNAIRATYYHKISTYEKHYDPSREYIWYSYQKAKAFGTYKLQFTKNLYFQWIFIAYKKLKMPGHGVGEIVLQKNQYIIFYATS